MPEYRAGAQANLACFFWRMGDFVEASYRSLDILDQWQTLSTGLGPFEWIALFPLLVIAVLDVQIEQAIAPAQRLLAPPQMWLAQILFRRARTASRSFLLSRQMKRGLDQKKLYNIGIRMNMSDLFQGGMTS